jgi:aerobic-type carbon monoxide dehydrogenase small subunit (CoxS/CutS family)
VVGEPTTTLRVNGRTEKVRLLPGRSLLAVLRHDLGLTGTKYGCGEGECGACSVLLGGALVRACQIPLTEVGDREVVTIEGIAGPSGDLSTIQRAFAEVGAFQCGFCTPGMIVAATGLVGRAAAPGREEIQAALEGNVCRCGGYLRIVRAVERAVELRAQERRR